MNQLKKENTKAQNVMLQSKIKNLEANLSKAVSTYDDTVAHNNTLKQDIDRLRREKKNYLEMQKFLDDQIAHFEGESRQQEQQLLGKKQKAQELKQQIVQIQGKNEEER